MMTEGHKALVQRARQMAARQVFIDEVTAMLVELCNALSGQEDMLPEIEDPSHLRQDVRERRKRKAAVSREAKNNAGHNKPSGQ